MSNGFIGPTQPEPSRFSSPWGELGGGGGGGGAAATASGFPFWLIPIVLSLLQTAFKKSPTQEAEDLKKQMAVLGLQVPYRSPYMSTMDPAVIKALLARLGQTSNWGWPAGKQMDTSFIDEALKNIGTTGGDNRPIVTGL